MKTDLINTAKQLIENNLDFQADLSEMTAHDRIRIEKLHGPNLLTIDGDVFGNIENYHAGTYDNPEEYDITNQIFEGEIILLDHDGEELFYKEIEIKL